ncbi:hypothetical protein TWF506_008591 [Arthrobotrys conoides]|uniref:Uncharacterized protein n=1 Tax=Arthrobotrys conoides TaxID=74498 RepID=A0AAN8NMY0_9PEZI
MNWVGGTRARRRGGELKPAAQQKQYFARLRSSQTANYPINEPCLKVQKHISEHLPRITPLKSRKHSAKRHNQSVIIESHRKSFARKDGKPVTKPFVLTLEASYETPRRVFRKEKFGFGGSDRTVDIQTINTQDFGLSITDLYKEVSPTQICDQAKGCYRSTANTAFEREQNQISDRKSTRQRHFLSRHGKPPTISEYVNPSATAKLNWKAYILSPYRNPVDKSRAGLIGQKSQGAMLVYYNSRDSQERPTA